MRTPADWQSAIQQVTNLRYRRALLRQKIWAKKQNFHGLYCKMAAVLRFL
jgi:hypothetical protein